MARVGIFGAGWVGLVTGACLADLGHEVVVRDVVAEKVEALSRGEVPFHEQDLPELLERNGSRLSFTIRAADLAGCEFLFVCVDTPPTLSGDADLSRVWRVVDELPELSGNPILVMKSTVPVGTGDKVRHGLDERGLGSVGYVSNPEFLAEGTAVRDFMHPDRIAIGCFDEAAGDAVAALYSALDAPIVRSDVKSAEMVKLAANAFLMTRISFINEIANVCEATGADVVKVAEGVGLDRRLGPHFLRAGIGYGGSCLAGRETVLVRLAGRSWLTTLERLYRELQDKPPLPLEVLAWSDGEPPAFLAVSAVTRRHVRGEIVELRTELGRRLRCTPDHPLVTSAGVKQAGELTGSDWLPIALGASVSGGLAASSGEHAHPGPPPAAAAAFGGGPATIVRGRRELRPAASLDEAFWRVVGLYAGIGSCGFDEEGRLEWCFAPGGPPELVDELAGFWAARGFPVALACEAGAVRLRVQAQVLASWWLEELGAGAGAHERRIPDLVWEAPRAHRRALLRGLWQACGSWSEGKGAELELDAAAAELVDGALRLLGEFGVLARLEAGRVAGAVSCRISVSGAEQLDRLGELLYSGGWSPARASTAWVRVLASTRRAYDGDVYSLEVPGAHTFVTSAGLVSHNCFPKDSLALKQLASNSGYHFQLLAAVIEVNELQKRRVIGKLKRHLGSLQGKKVALLGLAFKPGTDDMREAPSIVLAARLIAEGAEVRGWDPVADGRSLPGVVISGSVAEAVAGADAAVIVTEWPELAGLASEEVREAMANPLIVDGRNLLDPAQARAAGFRYDGVGRPSALSEVVESV